MSFNVLLTFSYTSNIFCIPYLLTISSPAVTVDIIIYPINMKQSAALHMKSMPVKVVPTGKVCCNHDCNQGRDCPARQKKTDPFIAGSQGAMTWGSIGLGMGVLTRGLLKLLKNR
jgi:hypothetical protein